MSDPEDDKKNAQALTATQQLTNLVNGLLDEQDCPDKDRMTTKERQRLEGMLKALDESRVDETRARDLIDRLRQRLGATAEPKVTDKVTDKDVERVRVRINKMIAEHGSDEWQNKEETRKAEAKPKYIN